MPLILGWGGSSTAHPHRCQTSGLSEISKPLPISCTKTGSQPDGTPSAAEQLHWRSEAVALKGPLLPHTVHRYQWLTTIESKHTYSTLTFHLTTNTTYHPKQICIYRYRLTVQSISYLSRMSKCRAWGEDWNHWLDFGETLSNNGFLHQLFARFSAVSWVSIVIACFCICRLLESNTHWSVQVSPIVHFVLLLLPIRSQPTSMLALESRIEIAHACFMLGPMAVGSHSI